VNLAPVQANGISHNTYQSFNVPKAGVDLDNRTVGALTIINEVSGNQRSLLAGQLAVLGARANVILANPNGIRINGGSFVNTSGLVLTTGSVGFIDRDLTPFLTQKNARITTTAGQIEIGEDGLSGLFTHLVLAAREINIHGPVTNENEDSRAILQLIAGGSQIELDSAVMPGALDKPWLQSQPYNSGSSAVILVDITRPASLTASNIQIAVTEHGAGVRMAGQALASAGDFYLATNGEVRLDGAQIETDRNIRVERLYADDPAPKIIVPQSDRAFELTAHTGHVELLVDQVDLTHGKIVAEGGDVVLGLKDTDAVGEFRFVGTGSGDVILAGGGIGLYAQNQDMYLERLQIQAVGNAEITAKDFSLNRASTAEGRQESSFSAAGIELQATGDVLLTGDITATENNIFLSANRKVDFSGANITAAESVRLQSPDAMAPQLTAETGGGRGFIISAGKDVELLADSIQLEHGMIFSQDGNVLLGIAGQDATGNFQFKGVAAGDGIYAAKGGLGLYAQGRDVELENLTINVKGLADVFGKDFALIQASFQAGEIHLLATGAANIDHGTMQADQNFKLDSASLTMNLSKVIAQNGGLLVYARQGGVTNEGGLIQGSVAIDGETDSKGGMTILSRGSIYNHSVDDNNLAIIFASGRTENGRYQDGDLFIDTEGDLTNLTGRLISNSDVRLNVSGKLYNCIEHSDPPQYGEMIQYKRKTGWFIFRRTVSGWYVKLSDLKIAGQLAYILAGKGIFINAGEMENDGGEIDANGGDLRIDTSRLVNRAVASGNVSWERSSYWFWQRDKAASSMRISGGNFSASGDLLVNATESVSNSGGQLLALNNLTINAPVIGGEGMSLLQAYERENGMREIWLGRHVRIIGTNVGGSFIAWGGDVNLLSPGTVLIHDGAVQAGGAVNVPGGLSVSLTPPEQRDNYGFLDFLF
jgi:filamentous hemagglutinin family protein